MKWNLLIIWGVFLFRGQSSINLDAKGRLAVPTKYRTAIQDSCDRQMIVTVAMDTRGVRVQGCLWLYPLPEWEKLEHNISKQPTLSEMTTRLRRFLIGSATECDMDGQGRLLVPEGLRKFANLEKHIVLIGQINRFDIWNDKDWLAQEDEFSKPVADTEENREIMSSMVF